MAAYIWKEEILHRKKETFWFSKRNGNKIKESRFPSVDWVLGGWHKYIKKKKKKDCKNEEKKKKERGIFLLFLEQIWVFYFGADIFT